MKGKGTIANLHNIVFFRSRTILSTKNSKNLEFFLNKNGKNHSRFYKYHILIRRLQVGRWFWYSKHELKKIAFYKCLISLQYLLLLNKRIINAQSIMHRSDFIVLTYI